MPNEYLPPAWQPLWDNLKKEITELNLKYENLRLAAQKVVDEYEEAYDVLPKAIQQLKEVLERYSNITNDYTSFESRHAGEQRDLTK
jgi:archaellum component FlaC